MENPEIEKLLPETDEKLLTEAAKAHAETPEGKELKGEELMKKAIQTVAQIGGGDDTGVKVSPAQDPLADYAKSAPPDVQAKVESLLQVAAKEGLSKAVSKAAKDSPYVLDAFHDSLAAKLYPYLKEKGLLK